MLLSAKLKDLIINAATDKNIDLEFHLKNICINGVKRGCSGFVVNKINGAVVYLTTETQNSCLTRNFMYRYADNINDFKGYHNRWADTSESLAKEVCELLLVPVSKTRDMK